MSQLPATLQRLLQHLQQIPYVASKNVFKIAHHLLIMDDARRNTLVATLQDLSKLLQRCARCWTWHERHDSCQWCSNGTRDQRTICVVQEWYDLYTFEKSGGFNGVYHILGGVLSPLEGVHAHHLSGQALIDRIAGEDAFEIIFALSQTPEAEATAAYIARLIQKHYPQQARIRLTSLSRGVPVGASLDHLDRVTLSKALAERRPF